MAKGRAAAAEAKKLIGLIGKTIRQGTIRPAAGHAPEKIWPKHRKPGTPGTVDRSQVRNLYQHELDTAARLAKHGHDVTFLPRRGTDRSPDALIDGRKFEFKAPEGGNGSIGRNVRNSAHQARRAVLDNTRSLVSDYEALRLARSAFERYRGLDELWVITKDGLEKWTR
ncbi:hypothetical protein ACQCX2_14855 [Propionibacteriaceae bacterium Y1700]|uniref:CdiA C-terminal domain-containing protein n=1 Tax=Microlunatus sp. Y1700 TaxID=3418487 RepID=UPI003DA71D28